MMREQRKDRKKINKKITDMIRRAAQKDEEQIIEFATNQTPMWEILLCYQYQADKQVQTLTTKVLQNMLHKANEAIGFSNTLTYNTTLGFDERCVAFLAIVRGQNHDMDEISTGTLYYLIQLFEEFLEDEKLKCLEEPYKDYRQMILNIQLHNILPLAHLEKEKLIQSCQNDLAFTLLIITAWLFLHECSLLQNVRNEWISSIDTLDTLFEFLEIDNACLKDILINGIENYVVDDEDASEQLEYIIQLSQMIDQEKRSKDHEEMPKEEDDVIPKNEKEKLVSYLRYCFEIQNEMERIMSYYCAIIMMTHQIKEIKGKEEQIENLIKQINKGKKSQEKQKEQALKQNEQILELEKKLKLSKQETLPIAKENERLKVEVSNLKNQINKLKTHIDHLEKVDKEKVDFKEKEIVTEVKLPEIKKEAKSEIKPISIKSEEVQFNDMTKEINKHKITILGGPARFARRVKEFLPNARVIDMGSKFGEIRIGSSDYVVVYWKMLGHARTMQVEAQIKGSSTKIIYVDSTNKFELCKTIYENL